MFIMRYIPLEKLDVVMPTLNSVSRIGEDIFRKDSR